MLDRAISTKCLNTGYLCRVAIPIFKKFLSRQKMAAILNLRIFRKNCKTQKSYISKTVLDRADYADFGCHNSIRLKAEHFLNTLALTFMSFSGCFVFAVQKHYLFFFASDPLVLILNLYLQCSEGILICVLFYYFYISWC